MCDLGIKTNRYLNIPFRLTRLGSANMLAQYGTAMLFEVFISKSNISCFNGTQWS